MDLLKRLSGSTLALAVFAVLCAVFSKYHAVGVASPLLFVLCAHGLTQLVTESKILWPYSQLAGRVPVLGAALYEEENGKPSDGLLTCAMCSGMWTGAIVAALGVSMYPIGSGLLGMRDLIAHGVISSGTSFFVHVLIEKLKK